MFLFCICLVVGMKKTKFNIKFNNNIPFLNFHITVCIPTLYLRFQRLLFGYFSPTLRKGKIRKLFYKTGLVKLSGKQLNFAS